VLFQRQLFPDASSICRTQHDLLEFEVSAVRLVRERDIEGKKVWLFNVVIHQRLQIFKVGLELQTQVEK
jgi:hypothetical protein